MNTTQSPFAQGRHDNNIGFLRLAGAFLVLFGHNWVLFYGPGVNIDPLSRWILGNQLSHELIHGIGINLFFVLSGFLISKSFVSSQGLLRFCIARVLRIYPALIINVLLTVFVLGALLSTLPLQAYLQHDMTWMYLWNNASLIKVTHILPGVFNDNVYPDAVNGSLWSLPLEMSMYVFAFFFGVLMLYRNRLLGAAFIASLVVGYFVATEVFGQQPLLTRGLFMVVVHFMLGMLLYMFRDLVLLRFWLALLLYVPVVLMPPGPAFELMSSLAFAYLVLWLAYTPRLRLPRVERYGDMSYGLYLYAFPVQQWLIHMQLSSVWAVLMAASVICLSLAMLSWHLVEQRSLQWVTPLNNGLRSGLQRVGLQARWL
ncbi:acyltransferase family protein [Halopseudomonas salegens]|uniref:Peptidoglycan/LPS O-acetylase OafA/YrhL, contains acyltransferase and SGNH-hydrolase domains n=1 Tax=Halopseudomonas salegens TaxID=1434072 RepID=A0A1H2EN38_9GAMM|nr:acyltransferase [Halopseudomonas salegens]SDT96536.1 Peptidoglycan/LPS O-acetylase OafA/YrhL, contains acyltransferase and SGNH-hydrolase domains [Halopseudomonas salegens]